MIDLANAALKRRSSTAEGPIYRFNNRNGTHGASLYRHLIPEVAFNPSEPMLRLPEHPLDHPFVVVAPGEDVIQGREAALLTFFLHLFELPGFELVVLDSTPVVSGRVHGEARCQRAVHPDDQRVVSRPAAPIMKIAMDEVFHLRQTLY